MPQESRHGQDNQFNLKEHLDTVEKNIASIDSLDVSLMLVDIIKKGGQGADFTERLRGLVKKYQEATGRIPSFDLVFVADDLGSTVEEKRSWLKFLKSILEGYGTKSVKSITVKGDRSVIDIEPNVFSSGVKFEELK